MTIRQMTYEIFLPLENLLWHKPSTEMFSHSLHLPQSQFWVHRPSSWYRYQSCSYFESFYLQKYQARVKQDRVEWIPSRAKLKTWQSLMKWFRVDVKTEEQTKLIFQPVSESFSPLPVPVTSGLFPVYSSNSLWSDNTLNPSQLLHTTLTSFITCLFGVDRNLWHWTSQTNVSQKSSSVSFHLQRR